MAAAAPAGLRCPRAFLTLLLAGALGVAAIGRAAVPTPEKLLPDDTMVLVTIPDFTKFKQVSGQAPPVQLWNDPAMAPFRDKFMSRFQEEFVKPLERELDVKFADYAELLQGQLTFGVTQNGWPAEEGQTPGVLLLLDTKDKSDALKKNLADWRKKWVSANRVLKTEKIRDREFMIVTLSSNDMPKTLSKFFPPGKPPAREEGEESKEVKPAEEERSQVVIGQVESLLVLGNSTKAVEKIVGRMTGALVPALAEQAAYQAQHAALLRDSPGYGWINLKAFVDSITRQFAASQGDNDAANPLAMKPDKILAALGLSGLRTMAVAFQRAPDGASFQMALSVPESSRQGLFKILAGVPKEATAPPFVPATAAKFQRWRLDGQQAWSTLEKACSDISPQLLTGLNFLLDTANAAAKEKDAGFDFKKSVVGNLGDDLITYEKPAKGSSAAELQSPPSLFLLGSPNAEQLAGSLKSLLSYFSQQSGTAIEEREFLGRKIYSVPLQALALPFAGAAGGSAPRSLNCAASGGYVAFSSDPAMVEEYLRSAESQGKALRETAGLAEAAQRVTGAGTSLFGYENQAETSRVWFEAARKGSVGAAGSGAGGATGFLPPGVNVPPAVKAFQDWMDFSLLPPFEKVAKYFHFSVYGVSANADGLTFKVFAPTPPGLRGENR
jgi:hypothetical protein